MLAVLLGSYKIWRAKWNRNRQEGLGSGHGVSVPLKNGLNSKVRKVFRVCLILSVSLWPICTFSASSSIVGCKAVVVYKYSPGNFSHALRKQHTVSRIWEDEWRWVGQRKRMGSAKRGKEMKVRQESWRGRKALFSASFLTGSALFLITYVGNLGKVHGGNKSFMVVTSKLQLFLKFIKCLASM